jgi:hypothetical protein
VSTMLQSHFKETYKLTLFLARWYLSAWWWRR